MLRDKHNTKGAKLWGQKEGSEMTKIRNRRVFFIKRLWESDKNKTREKGDITQGKGVSGDITEMSLGRSAAGTGDRSRKALKGW